MAGSLLGAGTYSLGTALGASAQPAIRAGFALAAVAGAGAVVLAVRRNDAASSTAHPGEPAT